MCAIIGGFIEAIIVATGIVLTGVITTAGIGATPMGVATIGTGITRVPTTGARGAA
jgi:hypothetical protein